MNLSFSWVLCWPRGVKVLISRRTFLCFWVDEETFFLFCLFAHNTIIWSSTFLDRKRTQKAKKDFIFCMTKDAADSFCCCNYKTFFRFCCHPRNPNLFYHNPVFFFIFHWTRKKSWRGTMKNWKRSWKSYRLCAAMLEEIKRIRKHFNHSNAVKNWSLPEEKGKIFSIFPSKIPLVKKPQTHNFLLLFPYRGRPTPTENWFSLIAFNCAHSLSFSVGICTSKASLG